MYLFNIEDEGSFEEGLLLDCISELDIGEGDEETGKVEDEGEEEEDEEEEEDDDEVIVEGEEDNEEGEGEGEGEGGLGLEMLEDEDKREAEEPICTREGVVRRKEVDAFSEADLMASKGE